MSNAKSISSFEIHQFVVVSCHKCGNKYTFSDEMLFNCFEDIVDAKECIEMDGWEVKGEMAFCNDCK